MHRNVLLVLSLLCLDCRSNPEPKAEPNPAAKELPAPPAEPPEAKDRPISNPPAEYVEPTLPGPGAMDGSLSRRFPEVRVRTKSSFAHDRGDMISLERLSIVDKECDRAEVVAAIVAYRGGWSLAGGSSQEDALKMLEAFVEDWAAVTDGERVTDPEEPEDLKQEKPADLEYHPPRFAIQQVEGQQVVVASYFERGHVGMRGRQWAYVVRAFRLNDGTSVDPEGTSLPQPRRFSSR